MDVFVVPAGADRYELYHEADSDAPLEAADAPGGFGGLRRKFHEMLAAAEHHRHHAPGPPAGWTGRVGRRVMRLVAEAVAEQRLLWRLRHHREASLVFPSDMTEAEAFAFLRPTLARDRDRHRFWMGVHALLAAITGPLFFFVPGPNLVAYYFVFRFVGHYLAWRGARHGLDGVRWTALADDSLAEIRRALALDAEERNRRVAAAAARLRLAHLAAFVRRTGGGP
jgi:hypothetical protein